MRSHGLAKTIPQNTVGGGRAEKEVVEMGEK